MRERAYRAVFMGYGSLNRDAIKIVASYRNIRRKRMYASNSNFYYSKQASHRSWWDYISLPKHLSCASLPRSPSRGDHKRQRERGSPPLLLPLCTIYFYLISPHLVSRLLPFRNVLPPLPLSLRQCEMVSSTATNISYHHHQHSFHTFQAPFQVVVEDAAAMSSEDGSGLHSPTFGDCEMHQLHNCA